MLKSSINTYQIKATKSILIFILLMMCGVFVFAQSDNTTGHQCRCFLLKENSTFEQFNVANIFQLKHKSQAIQFQKSN